MTIDTIFALSSGQPPAAIGVIRLSGPSAGAVLSALAGRLPKERRATLATIRDPGNSEPLDSALLLWFPGPNTASGEDLAEIHCHGGRGVTAAILGALAQQPGCRLANPGEFTRRAFQNGRIDLNEAEGLADLLFAETESQRRAAMAMAQGHFSRRLMLWQNELLVLSALAEAALDFSDEDDVPEDGIEQRIRKGVSMLLIEVEREQARPSAEQLRDGIRVVIAGPPNAGKSTLLNALVGRDAAIVSDVAGTTRDRIDVSVSFGGTPFLITDTAGIREESGDAIEAIGVERAFEAMEAADIIFWLGDPRRPPEGNCIKIAAQSDRLDTPALPESDIEVSALTGAGMSYLVEALKTKASALLPKNGEYVLHARQRIALGSFADALSLIEDEDNMLIIAEQLRQARLALDRLTGKSGTEDMLDQLFGNFCIGK